MDSSRNIKDTAARWIARRGGPDWSPQDEAELEQWLDASTGNLIAFLRMEAAWQEADRLKVLGAGFKRGQVPDIEDFRASPFFKHIRHQAPQSAPTPKARMISPAPWLAAASVLIVVALSFWGWTFLNAAVYSTPVGVTAIVPLPDGSKATLNTNSKIRVTITEQERRIELAQGEAFFEVARDISRPFTVSAGNKRIMALGTKFSVRRERNDVLVVVTEGQVRVEGSRARIARLSAGSVVRAQDEELTVQDRTLPQAEELLSWRSGYVVFHETSLADAIAEFNRYNTRQFIIEDSSVATLRISGNFRATNVDSFSRLLEDGFPVRVDRQEDRIVLSKRQPL